MTGTPPLGDQLRGLAEALTGALGGSAAGEDHSAECRTCPVCTALAVLRGQRPDLSEALADLLTTAAAALRGLARPESPTADPTADPVHDAAVDQPDPGPAPVPVPVQRIEVA
ncbi:hypothetical protein [Klenkia brasiliensis]|uniref:Uncharacterized protein n=1 Tax=Klenkia brasiliensis TaxID=333142 RepID=A0A1G7V599_9ACTN|nr:hypothetical protein [Klenkia brasiliensis]SDG54933.1 hypothetical protein SAMN05660324_2922 [Klenkia brasiliensis]